jgi:hypothetical protein
MSEMVQRVQDRFYFRNTKVMKDYGVYGSYLDLIGPFDTREQAAAAEQRAESFVAEMQAAEAGMMIKLTPERLSIAKGWSKAWGGRLLHFVVWNTALCGVKPKYWHRANDAFYSFGVPRCKKCQAEYNRIMGGSGSGQADE